MQVLVEEIDEGVVGRAAHQGPEVDGNVQLNPTRVDLAVGTAVTAVVTGSEGADLLAELRTLAPSATTTAREQLHG